MGSFNVACSISNISIGPGKPVMFLPLLPPVYVEQHNKGMYKINDHMLIYPHCFFHPLCLPIKGKYDDYGNLEEVEEDDNTKAIEEFIGLPIQAFMDCCTCGRGAYDDYSELFKYFAVVKKELQDYHVEFGDSFLKSMGFRKLAVTGQAYYDFEKKDFPFLVRLKGVWAQGDLKSAFNDCGHRMLGLSFDVIDSEGNVAWQSSYHNQKDDLQKAYFDLTGYHINIKEEDQWKVKLFNSMSGMFIHGEVYDRLAASPKDILERWGMDDKSFGDLYDEFHKAIVEYDAKPLPEDPYLAIRHEFNSPFDRFGDDHHFKMFFRDWRHFKNIYEKALRAGKLKESFVKFYDFYRQMYSANRFYFPAMNGEQCGNHEASMNLAHVTIDILGEELEERRRWYEEDEGVMLYAVEDEHQW